METIKGRIIGFEVEEDRYILRITSPKIPKTTIINREVEITLK